MLLNIIRSISSLRFLNVKNQFQLYSYRCLRVKDAFPVLGCRARVCAFPLRNGLHYFAQKKRKFFIAGFSYPLEPYIEIYLCIRTRAFRFYASFIELRAIRIYIYPKKRRANQKSEMDFFFISD